jgi:hypothetical protein
LSLQIRPSTLEDVKHLSECLAKDPWHSTQTVEQWASSNPVTYLDNEGPVFHVVFEDTKDPLGGKLRLHIQFDPDQRRRNALALIEGFPKVKQTAKDAGFTCIEFDSTSPKLVAFCTKYFGFVESSPEKYSLSI